MSRLSPTFLISSLTLLMASCGGTGSSTAVDAGPEVQPMCGTSICQADEMCLDDTCVAQCDAPENLCGPSKGMCCVVDEACIQDSCVPLGEECETTDDCDMDEICEPILGKCIPRDSVEACEFVPPPGVFEPEVNCRWFPGSEDTFAGRREVVMTPSVMNMTDDNDDGKTDANDIPDIVFTSFDRGADGCCTSKGVIRLVSGACNADGTMTTIATIGDGNTDNSAGIALANLHPATELDERAPEIVAVMRVGTVAYRRTSDDGSSWEEYWRNSDLPSDLHSQAGAQPSIADMDGDGKPEVIIGNIVLNGQTGEKIWDGRETVAASAGIGNNSFLGPVSAVSDLDLDGKPEVIAGNTVYNGITGAEVWTYDFMGNANSGCAGSRTCDGYNAIGNFDSDDEGEVVMVRRGEVFVVNHDGSLLHQVALPVDDCSSNESGPPTVADFDGDGRAEIGTAGADFYIVVDFDCVGDPLPAECDSENILWKVPNRDCSSRATGASVFDFNGDGSAEVVYADETSFRVFNGRDGTIIYEDNTHESNTRLEMPIVVDVDNDGKSEIIVPEPNQDDSLGGIEIWQDTSNNWVRTRRVWNQHSYHVTNISEDGQVPTQEEINWLKPGLNNFRQNVQPDGLFDAADLQVEAQLNTCQAGTQLASITVRNAGAIGVGAGVEVFVQVLDGATVLETTVLTTTMPLLPGESEVLSFTFPSPTGKATLSVSVDNDGMGNTQYSECIEDNNDANADVSPCGGID